MTFGCKFGVFLLLVKLLKCPDLFDRLHFGPKLFEFGKGRHRIRFSALELLHSLRLLFGVALELQMQHFTQLCLKPRPCPFDICQSDTLTIDIYQSCFSPHFLGAGASAEGPEGPESVDKQRITKNYKYQITFFRKALDLVSIFSSS